MATPDAQAPEELLAQIADLVQQYLAIPGDTPLRGEFESLMPVIQQATGAQGAQPPDQGAMPPDQGAMPPDQGAMPMDQQGAPQGSLADALGVGAGPPPTKSSGGGGGFKGATKRASGDIKAAQKESGTKTGIPEQFRNKKRSKAS